MVKFHVSFKDDGFFLIVKRIQSKSYELKKNRIVEKICMKHNIKYMWDWSSLHFDNFTKLYTASETSQERVTFLKNSKTIHGQIGIIWRFNPNAKTIKCLFTTELLDTSASYRPLLDKRSHLLSEFALCKEDEFRNSDEMRPKETFFEETISTRGVIRVAT